MTLKPEICAAEGIIWRESLAESKQLSIATDVRS